MIRRLLLATSLLLLGGCSALSHWSQAAGGHLAIVRASKPVSDWLADPATPPDLAERLRLSQQMRDYAKQRVKELGLAGPGKARINQAGCLDRCEEGPVVVVYPEEVWYTYVDRADVDEIIEEHLVNGRVVERLRI